MNKYELLWRQYIEAQSDFKYANTSDDFTQVHNRLQEILKDVNKELKRTDKWRFRTAKTPKNKRKTAQNPENPS